MHPPEGRIPRDSFINKIRLLGYAFKRTHPRREMWRRSNPLHKMYVPRPQYLAEGDVRQMLRQAGVPKQEIDDFVNAARV
ncbi:MAG: hypothetical protein HY608_03570 [Planctomycetes bacterium]|nr:hypothetical protein [Planctomycetota bacterium]